jgi:replicative DNA helicase
MPTEAKLPAHDIDSEEGVIGSLLIDGEAIQKLGNMLAPQDFYAEPNALIFDAMKTLMNQGAGIDQITVAQELSRKHKLETAGGPAYLSHLISNVPTSLHLVHYATIVARMAFYRRLAMISEQIATTCNDASGDPQQMMDRLESLFAMLHEASATNDFATMRQLLDKFIDTYGVAAADDEFALTNETKKGKVIKTGFAQLDDVLNGMQQGDLIVLAGRPSMGKSAVATGIAEHAAKEGSHVAIVSLEMSSMSLAIRLIASESGVNSQKLQQGPLTMVEAQQVINACGQIAEYPIHVDDTPGLRMSDIRSRLRKLNYQQKVDLVVIDYMQLIEGERGDGTGQNRVQEVSYISRALKLMAKELNVPVIAVSQLSRAVDNRPNHEPILSDLRDSGTIEQDADVVMFVYREEYYWTTEEEWRIEHPGEAFPRGVADLIIAKHRNGGLGRAKVHFIANLAKFEDFPLQPEMGV